MRETPDVVVIGLSMPGMGGWEVVGRLLSPYPNLPVPILDYRNIAELTRFAIITGLSSRDPQS